MLPGTENESRGAAQSRSNTAPVTRDIRARRGETKETRTRLKFRASCFVFPAAAWNATRPLPLQDPASPPPPPALARSPAPPP